MSITLQPGEFSLFTITGHLRKPASFNAERSLSATYSTKPWKVIDSIIENKRTVYGVNTGLLARTSIPEEELARLQRNLLLSHATGTGQLLDDASVALIMALKAGLCWHAVFPVCGVKWSLIRYWQCITPRFIPVFQKKFYRCLRRFITLAHMSRC